MALKFFTRKDKKPCGVCTHHRSHYHCEWCGCCETCCPTIGDCSVDRSSSEIEIVVWEFDFATSELVVRP